MQPFPLLALLLQAAALLLLPTVSANSVTPPARRTRPTHQLSIPSLATPPSHRLPRPTLALREDDPVLPRGTSQSTTPQITQAPALNSPAAKAANVDDGFQTGVDADGNTFRFRQTTYYSCATMGTYAHCGWHVPIVEIGEGASSSGGMGSRAGASMAARAAVAAAVVCAFLAG
ncbi:hypothetical protein B0T25DRAFT_563795 [Lasiosphaeria hispida]|uniref:Uncharacterized protein n=1 Tax=Lasiosphaeria hispida TaxID=260671 RepID=A0AAJ0HNU1_9PEZI|nr:hypothetical protein B0T25DRAFT_563795 [Lasiosphaeria hispida]